MVWFRLRTQLKGRCFTRWICWSSPICTFVPKSICRLSTVWSRSRHCLRSMKSAQRIRRLAGREWLREHLPHATLVDVSTAEAVYPPRSIRRLQLRVLCPRIAMLYRFKHAVFRIDDNVTRFLVIGKTRAKPLGEGRDKPAWSSRSRISPCTEKALHPSPRAGST